MKSLVTINSSNSRLILIKRSVTFFLPIVNGQWFGEKVYRSLSFASLLFILLISQTVKSQITQNDSCHNSLPFCGSALYTFAAGVSPGWGTDAQIGPNYGCLSSQPNPAWYFMQIGTSGNIIIHMQSTPLRDIDYICWGPFTSPTGACVSGLTYSKIVDCSYSTSATEVCTILNAHAGAFYILLITNYSNLPCGVTFSQTNYGLPGAGSTNCDIVTDCSIFSLATVVGPCDLATGHFYVSGVIEYANTPATGQLTLTDITAVPNISQIFSAPFTSPQSYMLSNIPCDGLVHTITAAFSDSSACTFTQTYTAPSNLCPDAVISGGGPICNNGTDQTVVSINFTQGSPPYDFTYAINGVSRPPILNYSGPFPYQINTSTPGTYTLISVSNLICSGTVSGSAVVTLHPLPIPTIAGPGSVCAGASGNIYTTESGMTNYTWNVSAGGATTAGGTLTSNSVTVTWNTPGAQSVRVGYTDINLCSSATQTIYPLTVNPLLPASVSIAAVPSGAICPGTSVTFSATPTNGGTTPTYQWKKGGVNISGATNPTYTTTTLANADAITVEMTSNATPCLTNSPAVSNTITAGVSPAPLPTITGSNQACAGTTGNVYTTQAGMTNYMWNVSTDGIITAGGGLNDNTVTVTWPVSGSQSVSVNYKSGDGCIAPSPFTYAVIVNTKPSVINSQRSFIICSNTSTNIVLQSNISPSTFSWTTGPVSINITGYNNGNGVSINQTLVNSGTTLGGITYSVTPTASGCSGDTANFIVLVNASPDVSFSPLNPSACSGQSAIITLVSNTPGTTFSWTPVSHSPQMTGQSAGSGTVLTQSLINPQPIPGTVSYELQPTVNGCDGTSRIAIVTVNPLPAVGILECNDISTTKNARKIILKGGRPLGSGGQFSGIGVSAISPGVYVFDPMDSQVIPSLSGSEYTISYRYTNSFGCYDEDSKKIRVFLSNAAQICPGILRDVRDNTSYRTFQSGTGASARCWMAENLNFGEAVIDPLSSQQRDNCVVEKYCPDNLAAQCAASGGFYQWDELLQYSNTEGSKGICPPGWHLPSEQDWEDLINNNQGPALAGDSLKSSLASNAFHGLMSGMYYMDQTWSFNTGITLGSMFWTSTSPSTFTAVARGLNSINQSVSYYSSSRANAFNVRCVKD